MPSSPCACTEPGRLWLTPSGCFSFCVGVVGLWVLRFGKQESVLQIFISEMKRRKISFLIKVKSYGSHLPTRKWSEKDKWRRLVWFGLIWFSTDRNRDSLLEKRKACLKMETDLRFRDQFYNLDCCIIS